MKAGQALVTLGTTIAAAGGALFATSWPYWAPFGVMAAGFVLLLVGLWVGLRSRTPPPAPKPSPPTTIFAPNARRVKATDIYSEAHTVLRGDNVKDVETGNVDHRPST